MKIVLFVSLLLSTINSFAQEDIVVRVFKTHTDYMRGTSMDMYAQATIASSSEDGDFFYDIELYDMKEITKKDKNSKWYWGFLYNDTMYINQNIIQNKNYVPVIYANESYLYFRGGESKLKEHELEMQIAGQRAINKANRSLGGGATLPFQFGLLGGIIYAASKDYKRNTETYNYLIEKHTGRVFVINISLMQEILRDYPRLNYLYMKKGHPEDPLSIMKFLEAAEQE